MYFNMYVNYVTVQLQNQNMESSNKESAWKALWEQKGILIYSTVQYGISFGSDICSQVPSLLLIPEDRQRQHWSLELHMLMMHS